MPLSKVLSKVLEEHVVADPTNPTVSELTAVVMCQRGELDDAADDREGMEAQISCLEAMVADHETKIDEIKGVLREAGGVFENLCCEEPCDQEAVKEIVGEIRWSLND